MKITFKRSDFQGNSYFSKDCPMQRAAHRNDPTVIQVNDGGIKYMDNHTKLLTKSGMRLDHKLANYTNQADWGRRKKLFIGKSFYI